MNEVPVPVETLGCLGSPLGELAAESYVQNGADSLYTTAALADMQGRIASFCLSQDPADKEAVATINQMFEHTDRRVFGQQPFTELRPGQPNVMFWLGSRTHEHILARFALQNVARQVELARRLNEDLPQLDANTMQMTEQLQDLSLFPPVAKELMASVRGKYGPVHAMDSFEAGALRADGYCNAERIAIRNLYENPRDMQGIGKRLSAVALHENIHAAGLANGRGFTYGISSDTPVLVLEEIAASHFTEVAHSEEWPQPETLFPRHRLDPLVQPTRSERHLAGLLDIPAELIAEAFFSEKDSRPRAQLESIITSQFERHAGQPFFEFAHQYEAARYDRARNDILHKVICRLEGRRPAAHDLIEDIEPSNELAVALKAIDTKLL